MRATRLTAVELIRYVLPHWLAGCAAGVVASVAIVASNLGALRDLMWATQGGWIAFALLTFGFVVTFGSIAVGGAIMALGDDER
jgi:hypothetical protein